MATWKTGSLVLSAAVCLAAINNRADAQGYYPSDNCCQPATFAGDCCAPAFSSADCCAPQQYAPATVYQQQYAPAQQYAAPQAAPVMPQYGVGTGQFSYRPLLPIAQQPAAVQVGQGILGQPTVYVPGQPVRNLFRYISPF